MKFTTKEIISAGLGVLCCDMGRVYGILNYLTGDSLFTHQLPRAFDVCNEFVKKQHPWLLELDASKCTRETWEQWVKEAEDRFGKDHELEPLPSGTWKSMDPISELAGMLGGGR